MRRRSKSAAQTVGNNSGLDYVYGGWSGRTALDFCGSIGKRITASPAAHLRAHLISSAADVAAVDSGERAVDRRHVASLRFLRPSPAVAQADGSTVARWSRDINVLYPPPPAFPILHTGRRGVWLSATHLILSRLK